VDIKTTFIALTSIIILAVVGIIILYQANPSNTIPIYTSPAISCAKPFNKNYMGGLQ
jgi:hypothetical protein